MSSVLTTPTVGATSGAVMPRCAKIVQVNGVDTESCDRHYYNTLVPECQRRQSRVCWEAINRWYADCLAGKAKTPYRWAAGSPKDPPDVVALLAASRA
ncbi:hypothetical protein AB0H49_14005 [Nocardia sp. NPDC050713]|uniref:hypothetical protein n=1 Tax=Nocardia sp. NPDC050713 TaxID=3154511 RepID=UPI0033EAB406